MERRARLLPLHNSTGKQTCTGTSHGRQDLRGRRTLIRVELHKHDTFLYWTSAIKGHVLVDKQLRKRRDAQWDGCQGTSGHRNEMIRRRLIGPGSSRAVGDDKDRPNMWRHSVLNAGFQGGQTRPVFKPKDNNGWALAALVRSMAS